MKGKVEISEAGLMDFANAARYLGFGASVATLRQLRRTGRIPCRRVGPKLLIHRDDLDRFAKGMK